MANLRTAVLSTIRLQQRPWARRAYRYFDDFDARITGRFLTPQRVPGRNNAGIIEEMALPNNAATRLARVHVPATARLVYVTVAPLNGVGGGGKQFWHIGSRSGFELTEIFLR